ncbi:hypothetical protein FRC00_008777 [Tulasnella sp. 408]|nr:hypothetical protein FRC00_008777 [Tulasnella sp. 408]
MNLWSFIKALICPSPSKPPKKRAGPRPTKPLILNTIAAAAISEDSLPFSEPKSPRGAAKASTEIPFGIHRVDIKKDGKSNSTNSRKDTPPPSRKSTPVNSPEKKGDKDLGGSGDKGNSSSPKSHNATSTTSNEQVDDRQQVTRKGHPVTSHPLLDSYVGTMKDKKQTQVTLKLLRPIGKRSQDNTLETWKTEVRMRMDKEIVEWQKVDGPFVKYEGITTFGGVPAVITEFIEGTDAKDYLEKEKDKKAMKDKPRLILEFARALTTLHSLNLSHGSIEPCHFIVDHKGKAKLGGYCFNRMVEEEFEKVYSSEDYRNSARYVAPEVLDNGKTDSKSDVYSFALVALELMTGEQPFSSFNQGAAMIGGIKHGDPPFAEDATKLQDDPWWSALSSCLLKDPGARPSMEALYTERISREIAYGMLKALDHFQEIKSLAIDF